GCRLELPGNRGLLAGSRAALRPPQLLELGQRLATVHALREMLADVIRLGARQATARSIGKPGGDRGALARRLAARMDLEQLPHVAPPRGSMSARSSRSRRCP